MCTIEKQLEICRKHHLYMKDAMQLVGASQAKFKPVWEKMKSEYQKKTGNGDLTNWGLPTQFCLKYLDIDIDYLIMMARTSKKNSE